MSLLTHGMFFVARLAIPAVVLSLMSLAKYGLWIQVILVQGFFLVGASFFGRVSIQSIALLPPKGSSDQINSLLSTTAVLLALYGLCGATLIYMLAPSTMVWFSVEPHNWQQGIWLMRAMALVTWLELLFSPYFFLLTGRRHIAATKWIWMNSFMVELICSFLLLWLDFGLWALFAGMMARVLTQSILVTMSVKRRFPSVSLDWDLITTQTCHQLLRRGGLLYGLRILEVGSRLIGRLLAGIWFGPPGVAILELGQKLPDASSQIPASIATPLMPEVAALHLDGRQEPIRDHFLNQCRLTAILLGVAYGFLFFYGDPLMKAWLGSDRVPPESIFLLSGFLVSYLVLALATIGSATLRGLNRPRREYVQPVTQWVILLASMGPAFYMFDRSVTTLGLVIVVSQLCSSIVFLVTVIIFLRCPLNQFMGRVVFPGLLPTAVAWVLARLMPVAVLEPTRWSLIKAVLPAASVYFILVTGLVLFGLCSLRERRIVLRALTLR